MLASPEFSSSVSSVEEATEYVGQERRKTFNHLDIEDGTSVSKSPRFLPKFLRASFSKLLKDKPKTEDRMLGPRRDGYLRTWTVSTPVSRSPSINFDSGEHDIINIPEPSHVSATCPSNVSPDHSPTTGQFVAECLAKGLPIIPFNYSTAEIVERRRQNQRRKPVEVVIAERSKDRSEPPSPVERTPAPEWSEADRADKAEDKSLEGLLTLARREMEQEAQLRKVGIWFILD